ncbi:LOW QUALITY PROTEIN: transmembrane protease serine 11E-like [Dromiciops gliroides]|uniref:LOW QUALITY PROTEIN: transmembrane protease serine 11E-like n=1 Tax=Dromiciops gliroides TaxID=33562 RepID=UPI001CC6E928|nr:LOW QUALITY PROTEIN: transmembrane protease serine 11E-like [Dromiciops gliroides]
MNSQVSAIDIREGKSEKELNTVFKIHEVILPTGNYARKNLLGFNDKIGNNRPVRVPVRKRNCLQPWVIGLITFISLIVLAVCIGLIVHYVRYNTRKPYNYYSTLTFTSDKYYYEFDKEATTSFTEMSQRIESMVKNAFYQSSLRREFIKSQVIKFSPQEPGVVAHMLMIFKFPSTQNPESIKKIIQRVLHEKLQHATGPPKVDPSSVVLTDINKTETDNYLNNCCGTRTSTSDRIVGGNAVEQEGEWPWQASLQWDGSHRCGATLINATWLVSAAHCFRNYKDPSRWTASFGLTINPPKERQGIKRIIVHENYKYPSHDNDIAVLELSKPVPYTNAVHRVCLPDASHKINPGSLAYVTGFGAQRNDGTSVNHLQQVQVNIIDTQTCNQPQVYNNAISPGMICAGYLEGGKDACQGDSGGPMVSSNSREIWYLYGIVSWGDECAQPNKPGVYTRVTFFRDWIETQTGI